MDRKARSDLHQRRSRIARRSKSTEAVEFFNVLSSEELLQTTEALLPEHRERLYPPTVTLSMFMRQTLEAEQLTKTPGLDVREYIYDMADVMRAADLVICRAGASTVSELTALAVPAVIVPSPYVTNNHQEKNARILEKHGGARVILEKDATGEALYRAAGEILRSPELRRSMSAGMAELGIPDATERIYRTVMALRK